LESGDSYLFEDQLLVFTYFEGFIPTKYKDPNVSRYVGVEILKNGIPIEGSPFINKKEAAEALNTTHSN